MSTAYTERFAVTPRPFAQQLPTLHTSSAEAAVAELAD